MTRTLIEDFEALKERLGPHVRGARRAIVFGSVARGERADDPWARDAGDPGVRFQQDGT